MELPNHQPFSLFCLYFAGSSYMCLPWPACHSKYSTDAPRLFLSLACLVSVPQSLKWKRQCSFNGYNVRREPMRWHIPSTMLSWLSGSQKPFLPWGPSRSPACGSIYPLVHAVELSGWGSVETIWKAPLRTLQKKGQKDSKHKNTGKASV